MSRMGDLFIEIQERCYPCVYYSENELGDDMCTKINCSIPIICPLDKPKCNHEWKQIAVPGGGGGFAWECTKCYEVSVEA